MARRVQQPVSRLMKKVVIVGGGISGLSAAYHLETSTSSSIDYQLFESSPRLGGKIVSVRENGFTIEAGPDSFIPRNPAALNLCHALGLDDQIISSNGGGSLYIWSRNRLIPMPDGVFMIAPTKVLPFLKSPLISWPGKMRMGLEYFLPSRATDGDESLGGFIRRRLGQEALDKIAGPLMAGIYSGNPDKLSLKSTFPMFAEMERKHGSLLRAMLAQKAALKPVANNGVKRKAGGAFVTLQGGLQVLSDAVISKLPVERLRVGCPVETIAKSGGHYQITFTNGTTIKANAIIMATPAHVTAKLIRNFATELAQRLDQIEYVSTATVSLGYHRSDIPHVLDGSGFLVSHQEVDRKLSACTWSSVKFDHRAPSGETLLRVFLGGTRPLPLAEMQEADLIQLAKHELRATMKITAEPLLAKAYKWMEASPQYHVGHAARVAEMERLAALHAGLHLAGAAYHGAGVPDCIQSGQDQAKQVLKHLAQAQHSYNANLCAARMETA